MDRTNRNEDKPSRIESHQKPPTDSPPAFRYKRQPKSDESEFSNPSAMGCVYFIRCGEYVKIAALRSKRTNALRSTGVMRGLNNLRLSYCDLCSYMPNLLARIGWGYRVLMYFFRLSLKPVSSPDGFGSLDPAGRPFSRESWLRSYFSEPREFVHRGQDFTFVPVNDASPLVDPRLVVGYLARPRLLTERTPPSAGFEPTAHNSWNGALLVIDPTAHDDGQKIAFELRDDIGKPTSVLASLAAGMKIAEDPRPFDVQVHPIVEADSFWRFAEENEYKINRLQFDVAPPNMFGGSDEFSNELRQLRERNRVNRVRSTLTSETVLDVQQENIREIVDYTEKGAGKIRAQSVDKKVYNSKDHIKHDQIDTQPGEEGFWSEFVRWLGERF